MSVQTKYYLGTPGNISITDPTLANVIILAVTRSGTVYSRGVISPLNLQYVYHVSNGKITFRNAFTGPAPDLPVSINDLEKISVKYKI